VSMPVIRPGTPRWATEFDAWPVLVAAGAQADAPPKVTFPITGCWLDGAFTKRSVQFG